MTSRFRLYMAGLSDTGLARDHNEDYIAWDEARGLALLADGMGGHRAGDVASRLCVETLQAVLVPALDKPLRLRPNKGASRHATLLRRAVNKANGVVYAAAEDNPACQGMGTTLVAVLFYDDKLVVAHLGDSRCYRLREGKLAALTADHSLVRELLEQGVIEPQEARDNPYAHVITQAVGVRDKISAEVQEREARPGDVYLLCSDGLTDLVEDAELEASLLATQGHWPRAAQCLVDLANRRGGRDNISVVIAAVGAPLN
jgi:serine/threonine protein phosphatase PrpC